MKQRLTTVLLVLCAAAMLGGGLRELMAPGPLAKSHDDFAGNCDECHLVFDGIPDSKCLDCHQGIAERELTGKGWHASVIRQNCIECHTDHKGLEGDQTKPDARLNFNHGLSGFGLSGAHSTLACAKCHEDALEEISPTCGGCHDDPHASALGPECSDCHVDAGWGSQLKSLADHRVETAGGHDGLDCVDCHLHGENLSLDVQCSNCHEDGHGGTSAPCDQCHEVSGFKPAEFDHGPCTCAFPGKHQTVECLACHPDHSFVDTPILCSGCHDKDRTHEPLGECSKCHTATSWAEGRFDHNTVEFKIDGAHLAVSCNQCHAEKFRGVPTACAGCHAEAGEAAHGDFGACEECHTNEAFTPSSFDHATVGFPLTGQHGDTACQTCHAEKVEGYPSPP